MDNTNLKIKNITIGSKKRIPFLIVELSVNHNKSLTKCKELIKIAKNNSEDEVKIQTYTSDTIALNSKMKDFFIKKSEKSNLKYRKSLYFTANIKKNDVINFKNLKCIRSGYVDNPENLRKYLVKKARKNILLRTRASLKLAI